MFNSVSLSGLSRVCMRNVLKEVKLNLRYSSLPRTHLGKGKTVPPTCTCIRNCSSGDHSNRPPEWDTYGTWENRIEEPILLQQSIKHGIPIPKISLSNVGQESLIGRRLTNEDRIRVGELAPNLLYFGIYDGHGGAVAADFASYSLEHHVAYWLTKEHDLQVVLRQSFVDLENQFARYLHMELQDPALENSGTTATVCLLRNGNELVVANVGDSRAILCRKGRAVRLSRDHQPEVDSERERIEASKGFISWNSKGHPLVNGALAMTRSIGDGPLKRYGVTAQPETKSVEIKHSKDSMLVLVTDGIISVMTDQEICDSINQCHDPPSAAYFVADQALQFGSEDNASILVVPLARWGYETGKSSMYTMRWFEWSKQ
ncbi:protein phosphatase 1K, mitochondrial-like [Acanthaster planci]|uniref:Protein phosphatase 1K, mitochondrial-like n=1 Tax=Acanthaster planci TaxID=133434 RepID=A0A8B7Y8N3_ACAPL|nr:protein phosphatase 1K, mitochondrial-like [Acanthaster planci]XP_022088020.1 protein phosphatase 1K, mitochondrial-like [Acanthaster planci]XP_022088106.1 protein phosphatase 1K, mitochondrial-like [Acanthaster planci]XP_022088184.1 protein phosphatase 1K, mitochondrial-like [Acanthaster planci]